MQNTNPETTQATNPEPKPKREWDKPQIGGLYKKKTVSGIGYLSGYISIPDEFGVSKEMTRVVIYANSYKTEDKHPDFRIYLDTPSKAAKEEREKKSRLVAQDPLDAPKTETEEII